ncbi:MAG TPA: hypothetical protein VK721_08710 [Solirubrobacteraceae bacterium]|jgi:hypothetical protein|nr:hypothetical protein [Solirubrobacteraceae bacterium]
MPNEIIIAGAVAVGAALLFAALLAQWLNAQAMAVVIPAKGPCGFMPPPA